MLRFIQNIKLCVSEKTVACLFRRKATLFQKSNLWKCGAHREEETSLGKSVHGNFQIEEDYFYVNPLRKLSCIGCGEFLQTTYEHKSGYVPYSVYEKYSNGKLKFYTKVKGEEVDTVPDGIRVDVNNFENYRVKTKIILCKRCYRLQHYKSLDTHIEVDTKRIENIIQCRKEMQQAIGEKRKKKHVGIAENSENVVGNTEKNDEYEEKQSIKCDDQYKEKTNEGVTQHMQQKRSDSINCQQNTLPKEECYYDDTYRIDRRLVNIHEKKDVMKKRNEGKKLDVEKMELSRATYIEADRNHIMNTMIKKMKKKSLVLYLIDITNIENTIIPELYVGCKNKDVYILWLVNKVDCLPKSTNLEIIKIWFRNLIRQVKNSHINDLIFISALKFYNYNILEERMKYYVDIEQGTDIYIVGCVNVGKSTFVNSFLKYINYKHIGDIYNKRKKGGVTTSNIPYTTLNYNVFKLKKNINIIDTVGIPTKYQYSSILYKDLDLNSISINKKIQPFTYKLKEDGSVILGALCYINLIYGNFCLLTFYLSNKVTIHMCKTNKVESFLEQKKCTFLYPPHTKEDFDLLKPFVKHTIKIYGKDFESVDDIVISDLCWFSVTGRGLKILEVYAPKNIKIYRRPSMINDAIKHTQIDVFKFKSYRGRTNKILRKKKKLIQELNRADPTRREELKHVTLNQEKTMIEKLKHSSDVAMYDKQALENITHYL